MSRTQLERANRALIEAIETPPDTGLERRLDCIAATLWAATERDGPRPDPGMLCRLDRKLATLEMQVRPERTPHVERARERIRASLAAMEPAV